ncbi:MAG: hypothetical protein KDK51_03720 [Deltaproteobacteria bacterium]|nr:hypothetical protein [Deltaproteobacteria bacterium]
MKNINILFLSIFVLGVGSSALYAAEIACPQTWNGYQLLSGYITDIDPNDRREEKYLACKYGIETKQKEASDNTIYQNYLDCVTSTVHPKAFTDQEKLKQQTVQNQEQNSSDEPAWTYINHEGEIKEMRMTGKFSPRALAFFLPIETQKNGLDTFVCMLRIPAERIYGTLVNDISKWYNLKAIVGTDGIVTSQVDVDFIPSAMASTDKMEDMGAAYKTVGEKIYYYIPQDGQENGSIVKVGETYKYEFIKETDQEKIDVKGFQLQFTFTNQIRKITAEDNQND